jgi:hypothetical protein
MTSTPHDAPYERIDHHIDAVGKVSIGDIHNISDDPTRPASDADIGGLFGGGHGASGTRVDLTPP